MSKTNFGDVKIRTNSKWRPPEDLTIFKIETHKIGNTYYSYHKVKKDSNAYGRFKNMVRQMFKDLDISGDKDRTIYKNDYLVIIVYKSDNFYHIESISDIANRMTIGNIIQMSFSPKDAK